MRAKLIPQVTAIVVFVFAFSFLLAASQKKMIPWISADIHKAATLLKPIQSSGMATGSRKAYVQVARSAISASHITTAEGTTTHSSSVTRATLLYRSSCVGIYMPWLHLARLIFLSQG